MALSGAYAAPAQVVFNLWMSLAIHSMRSPRPDRTDPTTFQQALSILEWYGLVESPPYQYKESQ
jgi:hypothetical protein